MSAAKAVRRMSVPLRERCSRGTKFFSEKGQKIAVFFDNTSMLGSFVLEIRKLLATSEAEFNSPVSEGMNLNPKRADFC